MEFLNPSFLYAMAALAIPIIIHLFNFRRFKKVPFTNVRFLKDIKVQTTNYNRLKHLLILLMRLLALAFLILAFTRPFIPESTEKEETGSVSVFIDNSFSMEGESTSGPMLEVAKNRALDIANAYGSTMRFQALTQDFEGRDQYLISSSEFVKRTEDIFLSPNSRDFSTILERQKDLLSDEASGKSEIFIIGDFQKSKYRFEDIQSDTSLNVNLVQLEPNSVANVYIDSVWFDNPVRKIGTSEKLNVRIVNTGSDELSNVPLKLKINGKQKALGSFGMPGSAEIDTALYFVDEEAGIKKLVLSIDDYPLTYDDDYYLAYTVFKTINVLTIEDGNGSEKDFLGAVFKSDSAYKYNKISIGQIDYSSLKNQDLIILKEAQNIPTGLSAELKSFIEDGGTLWLIPSYEANFDSYNEFFLSISIDAFTGLVEGENKVRNINTEHPIYRGVFEKIPNNPNLPVASSYIKLNKNFRNSSDDLMSFGNGDPFLTSYSLGTGNIFTSTVALNSDLNNFSGHALFVATALRMAELSRATAVNSVQLSDNDNFNIAIPKIGTDMVFHLISENGEIDIIPPHLVRNGIASISLGPEFNTAGNYNVVLGKDTLGAVGVNYQRSESDRTSFHTEELEELASTFGMKLFDGNSSQLKQEVAQLESGTELWKICLILTLVFLLGESLLLRLFKR